MFFEPGEIVVVVNLESRLRPDDPEHLVDYGVTARIGVVSGQVHCLDVILSKLQIFPKDTPRPQVIQTMQAFAAALGVQCGYCHVGQPPNQDFASDEKPTKKTITTTFQMKKTDQATTITVCE